MITRRQFAAASAMLAAMHPHHRAFGQTADGGAATASKTSTHDMSSMPANWFGSEKIAFLIYPEFTALDMVGPHHMLTSLMGATTHVVAKTREIVKSDAGLMFQPSATFEDCPADLDIICVPGGAAGTLATMQDEPTIRFLKDRGSRAQVRHLGLHGIANPRRCGLANGIPSYFALGREVSAAGLWRYPGRGTGSPRSNPDYRRWGYGRNSTSAYRSLASFVIVNMPNPFNFSRSMPPNRLTTRVRRNGPLRR